jgi:Cys-rich protein (TIGR01571 family)
MMIQNTQPRYAQLSSSAENPMYVGGVQQAYVQQPPIYAFEVAPAEIVNNEDKDWKIDLCECGDPILCCYSFLCPKCALADARSQLDGSSWFLNCCLISPIMARWMIRTAYDIPGNAHYDCWVGACLPCCAINQMLQTSKVYGSASIPNVGQQFLVNERVGINRRPLDNLIYDLCYSVFCNRCAIGYASMSVGIPFWLGCCCFNIFEVNSAIRHHRRLRPMWENEIWMDCVIPVASLLTNYTSYFALIGYTTTLLAEENTIRNRTIGYGLDLPVCFQYGYDYYARGCLCSEPEGRYLHSNQAL